MSASSSGSKGHQRPLKRRSDTSGNATATQFLGRFASCRPIPPNDHARSSGQDVTEHTSSGAEGRTPTTEPMADIREVARIGCGFMASRALFAAQELDVFTRLAVSYRTFRPRDDERATSSRCR